MPKFGSAKKVANAGVQFRGLRARTLILSLVPLVLMGVTLVLVYFQINRLNQRLDTVISNAVPAVTTSGEIASILVKFEGLWWKAYSNRENKEELKTLAIDIDSVIDQMDSARDRYKSYAMEATAATLRKKSMEQWETIHPNIKKITGLIGGGEMAAAKALYERDLAPAIAQMKDTLSNIELNNSNVIESYRENATAGARNTTVFGLIISVVLSVLLSHVLGNQMVVKFTELTHLLDEQSEVTRDSSATLKDAAVQISASAEGSSAAIAETSAAIEQMRVMIKRTDENIKHSTTISQNNVQQLEFGQKSIAEVRDRVKEIQSAISEMGRALDVNNKNLSGILGIMNQISAKASVINDVVFQTKLLSFNASVEASRAGEHGKGFAVVAGEIGNLAASSKTQADEIGDLLSQGRLQISSLIEESTRQLKLVEAKIQSVVRESDIAVEGGMQTIDSAMMLTKQVDELLTDVSRALDEQARGANEVLRASTVLGEMASKTTEWGEKLTTGSVTSMQQAEDLTHVVESLKSIVTGRAA